MKYVIIGNSAAAIGCIEGIRKEDPKGKITLISAEKHHCYGRPLISYFLLGRVDRLHMKYRPEDFYEKNCVTTMLGIRAEKILAKEKKVLLDNGKKISYDRLLIATGSRAFLPPMKGIETVSKRTGFMTMDEALWLDRTLTKKSRVLIIGAGLIGMKCAEGIADRVDSVDLCDLADRVLPSVLDQKAASIVQAEMERHHCRFHLGTAVKEFHAHRALLDNGETVEFDVLVTAVGVRPNTELLGDAGGKIGKGICIDDHSRTSLSDIYAAGDCTESINVTTGEKAVIAIQPNAYLQGHVAGVCMAGGEACFDCAIPMNAGGFFDIHLVTAGSYDGREITTDDADGYRKIVVKDDLLKGFIIVGDISRSGIYTAMIKNRTPLSDIDSQALFEEPQLMVYGKPWREEKLGGVAK